MTLLQQALLSHQNRRFAEAEQLYRQVLFSDPRNFDALHLLGIVCAELGKYDEAEKNFRSQSIRNFRAAITISDCCSSSASNMNEQLNNSTKRWDWCRILLRRTAIAVLPLKSSAGLMKRSLA